MKYLPILILIAILLAGCDASDCCVELVDGPVPQSVFESTPAPLVSSSAAEDAGQATQPRKWPPDDPTDPSPADFQDDASTSPQEATEPIEDTVPRSPAAGSAQEQQETPPPGDEAEDGFVEMRWAEAAELPPDQVWYGLVTADWCGPCHELLAQLRRMRPSMRLVVFDYDQNRSYVDRNVPAGQVPQIWIIRNQGGRPSLMGYRIGKFASDQALLEFLDQHR